MEFSTRSMRMILENNTEKRISDEAADALGDFLNSWADEVGSEAVEKAGEDERATVRAEDIRKALRDRKKRDVKHSLDV